MFVVELWAIRPLLFAVIPVAGGRPWANRWQWIQRSGPRNATVWNGEKTCILSKKMVLGLQLAMEIQGEVEGHHDNSWWLIWFVCRFYSWVPWGPQPQALQPCASFATKRWWHCWWLWSFWPLGAITIITKKLMESAPSLPWGNSIKRPSPVAADSGPGHSHEHLQR